MKKNASIGIITASILSVVLASCMRYPETDEVYFEFRSHPASDLVVTMGNGKATNGSATFNYPTGSSVAFTVSLAETDRFRLTGVYLDSNDASSSNLAVEGKKYTFTKTRSKAVITVNVHEYTHESLSASPDGGIIVYRRNDEGTLKVLAERPGSTGTRLALPVAWPAHHWIDDTTMISGPRSWNSVDLADFASPKKTEIMARAESFASLNARYFSSNGIAWHDAIANAYHETPPISNFSVAAAIVSSTHIGGISTSGRKRDFYRYTLVDRSVERLDSWDDVSGSPCFVTWGVDESDAVYARQEGDSWKLVACDLKTGIMTEKLSGTGRIAALTRSGGFLVLETAEGSSRRARRIRISDFGVESEITLAIPGVENLIPLDSSGAKAVYLKAKYPNDSSRVYRDVVYAERDGSAWKETILTPTDAELLAGKL